MPIKRKIFSTLLPLLLVVIAFVAAVQCSHRTLQQHPLMVSENGRYLIKPDGAPFYWFADTEWVLNKHSDERVQQILDDRSAKGFTVIQVFAMRMAWDRTWDLTGSYDYDLTWAHTDHHGNVPFIDNKVTQLNPAYWQRWSRIIDEAAARGMYVLMLIGEPARKEGPAQAQSLEECYEYARQLGEWFKDKKNLLISISQDCPGDYGWGVIGWRAVAEGYADGVNGENRYDGRADYRTVFMTYHPWATSIEWFHADEWLDANGVQGSRNEGDFINDKLVYDRIHQAYTMTSPVKPVLFLEGSYEAEPNRGGSLPPTTARNVRMQFFYAVFAGSPGFSYGHVDNWRQFEGINYLNAPAVEQLVIAKNFMTSREWWNMQPASTLIIDGHGIGESRKAALRSASGDQALLFFPTAEAAVIDLSRFPKGKEIEATWFDPRNGNREPAGRFDADRPITFIPPSDWEDAVLVLKTARAK